MKFKLLLLSVSVLVSFLMLEGMLRLIYDVPPRWIEPQTVHLLDPRLGWILPANDHSFTIDAPVDTNSHGLRDDEMPMAKPASETRILSLGDSFTFALGVRFEDLYVQQLERKLRALHPERSFQVINAGVAGYNTTQELVFLLTDGVRYEPDLITLGFYWNDLLGNGQPLPEVDGPIRRDIARKEESNDPGHLLPAWIRDRLRQSLVLYLGVTRGKNLVAALGAPESEIVGIQRAILAGDAEALAPYWRATGERLRAIARAARERGIPVVLVSFPMENHVRQPDPSPVYGEALRREWQETGFPIVDLEGPYRASIAEGANPYLPYDLHPGPLGMEIASDEIYQELVRSGFVAEGSGAASPSPSAIDR
ncbi:MAG: GDSL-type esterase/lipase family protein [Myxococcota bacterium]